MCGHSLPLHPKTYVAILIALALLFCALALQARRKIMLGVGWFDVARTEPALGVAALAAGGLIFESQNTGAQNFIFLLPALIRLGADALPNARLVPLSIAATFAAGALLTGQLAERGVRFALAALRYEEPAIVQTTPFRVSVRRDEIGQAAILEAYMINGQARGAPMPGILAYAAHFVPVWHLVPLSQQAELAARIRDYEQVTGRRFSTVVELDFTDPLALILDRQPIAGMSTVYDPGRMMFPRLSERMLASLREADAIFAPRCPMTGFRQDYLTRAAPILQGRTRMEFGPCWTGYLKP